MPCIKKTIKVNKLMHIFEFEFEFDQCHKVDSAKWQGIAGGWFVVAVMFVGK